MRGFTRFVALGDSQTEGLWDGDDHSGLSGFADRLAVEIDGLYPGLGYANLAVRGHRIGDVLGRFGVPSKGDVEELISRVADLNKQVKTRKRAA